MDSSTLLLQVGVKVLLKNEEGKYLVIRRNSKKYPDMKPTWDIPGGRIHVNTPLLENLKREVKEETGLEMTSVPKLVAAQDIIRPDKHVVRLTYIGTSSGEVTIDEDSTEYAWMSVEELRNNLELDSFLKEVIDQELVQLQ